jgi:hypothetical protein
VPFDNRPLDLSALGVAAPSSIVLGDERVWGRLSLGHAWEKGCEAIQGADDVGFSATAECKHVSSMLGFPHFR